MKIDSKNFLNLYYAIMSENGIEKIRLYDIVEIVKAIYSSSETKELASCLNIEDLNLPVIIEHPFTKNVTDDEIIEFYVSDDDIDKILEKYSNYANQMALAINKVTYSKYIEKKSEGKIKILYDDSDGDYEITSSDSPYEDCETKVFTDGNVDDNGITLGNEMFLKNRKIVISNSTYSIVVDYKNKKPVYSEARAMSSEMIPMVIEETNDIMNGIDISHNIFLDKRPKVYKRKIH